MINSNNIIFKTTNMETDNGNLSPTTSANNSNNSSFNQNTTTNSLGKFFII